jgi:anti-anti-sigma regulatory factor
MTGQSRHGLYVVRGAYAPTAPQNNTIPPDPLKRPLLSLHQQSVGLAIGGSLKADTAGRLRMFLSMFTDGGGPSVLVLDLAEVSAVNEDGMAPIVEAEEAMRLRMASLRLASVSASVACFLDDVRHCRSLTAGLQPSPDGGPAEAALDDGRPDPGQV